MPLPIPGDLTAQTAVIFMIFVLFIALAYKLFKLAFSAGVAAAIGFSFPWINDFFKLGLPIAADLRTSIIFAGAALAIYVAYEFMHYIVAFFKIISWPFRSYLQGKEKEKVKKLEKEVGELKRKKRATT
ncbi:MAG: hypothetical protein QXD77_01370 [Candidatus Aenigmatarchaeota archaeon]